MSASQRWTLLDQSGQHVVEVSGTGERTVVWERDGVRLASATSTQESIVLTADDQASVRVTVTLIGTSRRVTLHRSATLAHAGLRGVDFTPEPGSPAALRGQRIDERPNRHVLMRTARAALGAVVPILLVWLLTLLPWPSIDVPSIRWPSIPWPDLPAIPWPEVPVPGWVQVAAGLVVPIAIGFAVARSEVRRRRASRSSGEDAPPEPPPDPPTRP